MADSLNTPIFIVGVQRSGTTLLAAMLASHSNLSCGPETHFFRRLSQIGSKSLCDEKTWPKPAVNFICSISHTDYSGNPNKLLIDKYRLTKQDIGNFLEGKSPSIPHILSSVTDQYMRGMGKRRWVEKTPDHINYLGMIRNYYPDSLIIHIIRDPRDVALSLLKLPWGVKTYLEALLFWQRQIRSFERFSSVDELTYTLRYEDLIVSPREVLLKLCRCISEEFEEGMLDTSRSGKQLNSRHVSWKEKVSQPIDINRVYAWRRDLPKGKISLTEAVVGDQLKTHNYQMETKFWGFGEVYPSMEEAIDVADQVEQIAMQGVRFWKSHPNEKTSVRIFIGNPGSQNWLGITLFSRITRSISIIVGVIIYFLLRRKIYWIPENREDRWNGYLGEFLKLVLSQNKYHNSQLEEMQLIEKMVDNNFDR